jgi:membrane associated rhomboid family serine protease
LNKKLVEKPLFSGYFDQTMGLADRQYMRGGPRGGPKSITVILMIVLVVVFALQCINDVYIRSFVENWLILTPACLKHGYVWQLITFQFLHSGLLHLICNLLGLWFFGRFVESVLGRQRFLVAYLGCGVVGGILQSLLMVLFPFHFPPGVYGASAGVTGIFAIFVCVLPDSEIRWNFILPMPAYVLLWITGGISLFFTVVPSMRGGNIAHAAHLGGLLAGIAWVKLGWHRDYVRLPWESLFQRWLQWHPFAARDRKRELVKVASVRAPHWPGAASERPAELPSEEFISREVDPILDKISAHGIQSLTERERKILEAARNKMAKR